MNKKSNSNTTVYGKVYTTLDAKSFTSQNKHTFFLADEYLLIMSGHSNYKIKNLEGKGQEKDILIGSKFTDMRQSYAQKPRSNSRDLKRSSL